jgi:protein-ribulosamine 3-kinase
MKENLSQLLESIYGNSIQIKSVEAIRGGCINETQVLKLSNGEQVFLKHNPSPPKNFFSAETEGLRLLEKSKYGPRVPRFLGISNEFNPQFLLLEYIEISVPKDGFASRFGQALAEMHRETQEQYGLDHDNFIGKTIQKNNLELDGLVFFREHRIRFQQELARKTRGLPKSIDKRLDLFCEKLGSLLNLNDEKPALLHGDLWSGNYFASHDQKPYIFDPAVYFGLREADLAMTEMFGRLPQEFYSSYQEVFPTQPGYTERKDIYNLYHLLNHYNLFGGSYLEQADQTVRCFLD